MKRYSVWQDDLGYIKQEPMEDGEYVLHSEAQARIEALEAALRATIAYMKDDSGGYEVYRATLDSAEAALGDHNETR